ncbi:hypothetical protein D5b_00289 [Faustovirus]|nr:hypothetical protein D5b_00289 [Faustovirus]AMN84623.1 hypothetical protein D6_00220 [Faustovirus]
MADICRGVCAYGDCIKSGPEYGVPDDTKKYCAEHKDQIPGAVKLRTDKNCKECKKTATFGLPGGKAEYCGEHGKDREGYVDLVHNMCAHPDCVGKKVYANWGHEGAKATHCAKHGRELGMVQLNKITCEECKKSASYGFVSDSLIHWCGEHSKDKLKGEEHATDLKNIKCKCGNEPSFGYAGEERGRYCSKCRLPGMVDIKHGICQYPGCRHIPAYNLREEKEPKYCNKHKADNMVNKVVKLCNEPDCNNVATHGAKNKPVTKCAQHKIGKMITKYVKTCVDPDCVAKPLYNRADQPPIYCFEHKIDGMVDVVNGKCIKTECNNTAHYGLLFEKPTLCREHAPMSYIHYTQANPICIDAGCIDRPLYAPENTIIPIHCETHKENGEINIVERKCVSCGLPSIIPSNNDKCQDCYEFNAIRQRKPKETKIKNLFDENDVRYEYYDRSVDYACTKKRPDFVMDAGKFKIVVEVDEFQHNYGAYNPDCEISRMIEIHQAIGMDTLFIRYNPDEYVDSRGIKMNPQDREMRLLHLVVRLLTCDKILPTYLCAIKQFYDGDDGNDQTVGIFYEYGLEGLKINSQKINWNF